MSEEKNTGMKNPEVREIWKKYQKSISFKQQLGLYDTVRENENFYIGKQWEGVQANGLPTPVFNFLKRVTMYQVASITSDNVALKASAVLCTRTQTKAEVERKAQIVNDQIAQIMERNALPALLRAYARNAAVDGDGCLYTYFDPSIENGQRVKGEIVTELVENTRVHFGNPNSRDVQRQPWILLSRRLPCEDVRWRAEQNGVPEDQIALIRPDEEESHYTEADSLNDERVTLLLYFERDRSTGHIWQYECTQSVCIRKLIDTETMRYPLTWLCWDYIQDCMHGQASITGLRPNQMFINRMFAMTMLSLMTTAYPKVIYDKTRLPGGWDSRVGAAIAVNGGDVSAVAKLMDPAQISPQVSQFIGLAIDYTQSFLGASDVAMGDARPDNTSAIIALQRAANTPLELTKQNLYQSVDELGQIYIDQMCAFYGTRTVEIRPGKEQADGGRFVKRPYETKDGERISPLAALGRNDGGRDGEPVPYGMVGEPVPYGGTEEEPRMEEFDFRTLRELPFVVRLDVGASSYWSEIASMQTLDNLLMQNKIGLLEYLERVPAGYIPKKQELIEQLRLAQAAQQAQAAPQPEQAAQTLPPTGAETAAASPYSPLPIVPGGGNGALQRAIVADEGGMKI